MGATVYGVYDYMLGGSSYLPPDRELAEAIARRSPGAAARVRHSHDYTLRVARWAAQRGIARFLRAGSVTYLPRRNVHDYARAVNPRSEVCYVNRDEGSHALMAALTSAGTRTSAVRATLLDPAGLLGSAPVARWIREGEPVCMIIWQTLTFVEGETAAALVKAYAEALPPGSALALTVSLPGSSAASGELLAMYTPGKAVRHTAEDVAGWLAGAHLKVEEPGVADVRPPCGTRKPRPRALVVIAGALALVP